MRPALPEAQSWHFDSVQETKRTGHRKRIPRFLANFFRSNFARNPRSGKFDSLMGSPEVQHSRNRENFLKSCRALDSFTHLSSTSHTMSQQTNKVQKRSRRAAYKKRRKVAAKKTVKSKK